MTPRGLYGRVLRAIKMRVAKPPAISVLRTQGHTVAAGNIREWC